MTPAWAAMLVWYEGSVSRHQGRTIRWPGEDMEWTWTGRKWVGTRVEFEGGDCWEEE